MIKVTEDIKNLGVLIGIIGGVICIGIWVGDQGRAMAVVVESVKMNVVNIDVESDKREDSDNILLEKIIKAERENIKSESKLLDKYIQLDVSQAKIATQLDNNTKALERVQEKLDRE